MVRVRKIRKIIANLYFICLLIIINRPKFSIIMLYSIERAISGEKEYIDDRVVLMAYK